MKKKEERPWPRTPDASKVVLFFFLITLKPIVQ